MMKISDHERSLVRAFLAPHSLHDLDEGTAVLEVAQIVSAIPWGEGGTIKDVLEDKKVGTCTGKHRVLQACLEELGIESRPVVCTFHWHEQEIQFPKELEEFIEDHHWQHGHSFLQVRNSDEDWVDLDATWDPPLEKYGFWPLPGDWDGEHSFVGLKILERFEDVDIEQKKDELINVLSPEQREWREHFLRLFIEWVRSLR